jgi:hypothetical protein
VSFAECAPRSFTVVSIQKNAPESSGVYGLSNDREWIFIGEASNIRARLLEHLNEVNTAVGARRPTGFVFELCSPLDCLARQRALSRQFNPICNGRDDYNNSVTRGK